MAPAASSATGSRRSAPPFLNRTGAAILLLTLLALAVILATQFSFGRAVSLVADRVRGQRGLIDRWREWHDERRRERERQQIIDKHVKKAGKERAPEIATKVADAAEKLKAARARLPLGDEDDDEEPQEEVRPKRAARPPAIRRAPEPPSTPPLPLSDAEPSKSPVERRKGGYQLPPVTLLDAAEGPAQDRRARADGCRAAARGEVPRVRRRGHGRPDSSRARS